MFDKASKMKAVTRDAASLAKELTDAVATRVKVRFDAAKALAGEYAAVLGKAATPSASQLQPCCKKGKCSTCRIHPSFSADIPVDLESSCLRYPATVSASIADGNKVPARETAALVAVKDKFTKEMAGDNTLKWMYVGGRNGGFSISPRTERSESKCNTYDPRLRPWYAEAVSGPKQVVVLVDRRGGDTRVLEAVQGALKVIDTLASRDVANVIAFTGGSGTDRMQMVQPGASTLACHGQQLLRTTVDNKAILFRFIRGLSAATTGATEPADYTTILAEANKLFAKSAKSGNSGKQLIVLISMYPGSDSAGPALKASLLGNSKLFAYTTAKSEPLKSVASVHEVITKSTVGTLPGLYHQNSLMQTGVSTTVPIASAFYADYSGLGIVTTVALPIGSAGDIEGVVGIDVPVMDMVSDLVLLSGTELSYAFMVDKTGHVAWHPAMPSPMEAQLRDFDLLVLEPDEDFKTEVYPALLRDSSGSKMIKKDTLVPVGDIRHSSFSKKNSQVTYAWNTVPDTKFIVVVAFYSSDTKRVELGEDTSTSECIPWHNGHGDCSGPSSQVFVAASAFTDGFKWMQTSETVSVMSSLDKMVQADNGAAPSYYSAEAKAKFAPAYSSRNEVPQLFQTAINEMKVTSGLESCWTSTNSDDFIARYIGTASSVFRKYPRGNPTSKRYDPTHRPWYIAASDDSSSEFRTTVSTPYLDASGNGILQTISRAVVLSGRVAAVVGMDFRSSYLLARLKQTLPKCNQNSITCILVDENGYVLLNGEVAPREEYVFLSEIHAGLAQNAIQKEILVRDSCVEYGKGQRRYTYKMSRKGASGMPGGRSGSENGVSLKCGQYAVREVPDTNLFIFVLTDTCDAGWSDCKPCTVENCREAVAKDTLKQVCMLCNCHMFHDNP